MNTSPKFGYKTYSLAIIASLIIGVPLSGQTQSDNQVYASTIENTNSGEDLSEINYLVTGVFYKEEQAASYCEMLEKKGCPSQVGYWKERNMYFCYATKSTSLKPVKERFNKLRKEKGFSDVWILTLNEADQASLSTTKLVLEEVKQETQAEPDEVVVEELQKVSLESVEVKKTEEVVIQKKEEVQQQPEQVVMEVKTPKVPTVTNLANNPNLLKTHNVYDIVINVKDRHNRPVPARVKILDEEASKVIAIIKSDQSSHLKINKNENQNIKLACEVFGYHKTIIDVPLGDAKTLTEMENIKILGERILIDLPLEAVHKGDLMVMFNVFFQPNSNILRPNSKSELETLLTIMQDNPNLKIRIHGHTNGKGGGEIIKMKGSDQDLFNPKEVEHTKGSAIKLSEFRADAVRLYLIQNGIAEDRIEVKGWGGKKMLYKPDSPQYKLNARVEVEVLDI